MKVINLYGGPGSGKSTVAAGLFYQMKMKHMKVELVTEYAKDLVYANQLESMLDQQEYIFATQNNRQHRLRNVVDWVITDSPLLLGLTYVNAAWVCVKPFNDLVFCTYNSYDNINIYLQRPAEFQEYGRAHNLQESREIDLTIIDMLKKCKIEIDYFQVDEDIVDNILTNIILPTGETNEDPDN